MRIVSSVVGLVCLLSANLAAAELVNTELVNTERVNTERVNTERVNIVWIITEDMSPHFGCYGERAIQTPHVDRLAAEGTRFSRAFVTAPICSISRSALITGMYQTSTLFEVLGSRPVKFVTT